MRVVTQHFEPAALDKLVAKLTEKYHDNDISVSSSDIYAAIYSAIGYLSSWGRASITDIYLNERDMDFQACYRDKPFAEDGGRPPYVIGAVYESSKRKFTFHS